MENIQQNYEWVELPSKGECYPISSPLRHGKVKVAYLKAMDENVIVSEKHIREKIICDTLLKRKVLNAGTDISLLCSGDKEAIVLWLLNTGYGNLYQMPSNSETIDLNMIKYKDFKLVSDDRGYFSYRLQDGRRITFRYLPYKEEERLIQSSIETLRTTEYTDDSYMDAYRTITIPLLLGMIVSVEGIEDIEEWLSDLDFEALRQIQRYITSNAAGLDMETTKGLIFDDSIFYNINMANERQIWA